MIQDIKKYAVALIALLTVGNVMAQNVAKIGDQEYATLQKAIEASPKNSSTPTTITLLDNIIVSAQQNVYSDRNVILNLNGKTITEDNAGSINDQFIINNQGKLTITGNGTITDDTNGKTRGLIYSKGELTIENGSFIKNYYNGNQNLIFVISSIGELSINGGEFINNTEFSDKTSYVISTTEPGKISVTNGVLKIKNSSTIYNAVLYSKTSSEINISGGSFIVDGTVSGTKCSVIKVYGSETVNITGGTFTSSNANKLITKGSGSTSTISISGGTYNYQVPTDYIAENYTQTQDGSNYVVEEIKAAQIGSTTYPTLQKAIEAATDGQTITLLKDITITSTINNDKNLTIDLNGHNILASGQRAIWQKENTLTLKGTGIISDENITNPDLSIIRVGDNEGTNAGIKVEAGVTVSSTCCYAISYFGTDKQTVDIYGKVSSTQRPALSGNGSEGYGLTTVYVYDGAEITSTADCAIYHPEKGTLLVKGGTITGLTGIEMRSGALLVNGGTIKATSSTYSCNSNNNGSTTKGAAVAIAQHTTKYDIVVNISGGTFEGVKAINEANPENNTTPNIQMNVSGGKFTGDITTVDVNNFIKGGTFDKKPAEEYCYSGYEIKSNTDGSYGVEEIKVAKIGEKTYPSLEAAIYDVVDGTQTTITLLKNVALTSNLTIPAGKNIILDLNDSILTSNNDATKRLEILGTLEVKNGTIKDGTSYVSGTDNSNAMIRVKNNGKLTVASDATITGSYYIIFPSNNAELVVNGTVTSDNGHCAISTNGSNAGVTDFTSGGVKITINDGATVTSGGEAGIYLPAGQLTVNGGTITGQTGIAAKGGKLTIKGGTINGTGAAASFSHNVDGWNNTGDAVAIESSDYPYSPTTVEISGGTFNSANAKGVATYTSNAAQYDTATGFVSGGTFSSAVPVEYCAAGYIPTAIEGGKYGVKAGNYVATIGTDLYETLAEAVAAVPTNGTETTIKLLTNVDLTTNLKIEEGKNVILDLNSKELTSYNDASKRLEVLGTLEVKNGTINDGTSYAAGTDNSDAMIRVKENGKLTVASNAIITGSYYIIFPSQNAKVDVYGKVISDNGNPAISTNGSNASVTEYNSVGAEITIYAGAEVTSGGEAGIYLPAGKLTVKGGTITGQTGVAAKGGFVNISGGEIKATGEAATFVHNVNGWNNTGDALAVESSDYPYSPTSVSITGGKFTSANGKGVATYTSDDTKFATATGFISGGTFSSAVPAEYCATDYTPKANTDGTYGVEINYVAEIDGTKYTSLDAAIAAVADGTQTTITLLKDVALTSNLTIPSGKDVVLDLNSNALTSNNDADKRLVVLGTLEVKNGTINDGTSYVSGTDNSDAMIRVKDNGKLTVASDATITGSYYIIFPSQNAELVVNGTVTSDNGHCAISTNGSNASVTDFTSGGVKITVNDGANITSGGEAGIYLPAGQLTVNGGTITGQTGIAAKGGKLTIAGGTINGTGAAAAFSHNVDGWNNTGDAVAIESSDYPYSPTTVEITDGTFNSTNAKGVATYTSNAAQYDTATGFISGGTFSSAVPADYCAAGFAPKDNGDGTYGVEMVAVAQIGSDIYSTFKAALTAAQSMTAPVTITLLADGELDLTSEIENKKEIIIEGEGKVLTVKGNKDFKLTGKTTINKLGIVGTTGDYYNNTLLAQTQPIELNHCKFTDFVVSAPKTGSKIVINGGSYTGSLSNRYMIRCNVSVGSIELNDTVNVACVMYNVGTMTINDGKYYSNIFSSGSKSKITIKGGTFNFDPSTTDYASLVTIPDEYECVAAEKEGWWIVKQVPAPETLEVYYNEQPVTLTPAEGQSIAQAWKAKLAEYPNATAFVSAQFAKWAKKQHNIIYTDQYAQNVCDTLYLTDLTAEGVTAENTSFYTPVKEFDVKNFKYSREMNDGWNSMVLPFNFTPADYNDASQSTFIFTKVLVNPVLNGNVVEFTAQSLGTQIEAGTPVIVHSTGGTFSVEKKNITLKNSVSNANGMAGTYQTTTSYQGKYGVNNTYDYLAPLAGTLYPFRACVNVASTAKALSFMILNDATGINEVQTATDNAEGIYTISGVKVDKVNKPGLYIVNGKKMFMK